MLYRIDTMKKYGLIIIIFSIFAVQFVITSSSHFGCNARKCEITELSFFNLIRTKRNVSLYEIEKFKLYYQTGMFPSYGSDGNFYYINAYLKNGEQSLFMDSYHTNKEYAEKVEKQLNSALLDKLKVDIDIKF